VFLGLSLAGLALLVILKKYAETRLP
jgi:hypothetical protein